MANVDLLYKVLDHIRENQDQHDQSSWARKTDCGSSFCFAGWTVQLSDYEIVWNQRFQQEGADFCTAPGGDYFYSIEHVAQSLLGLDILQKQALFFTSQTFDDVESVVKDIANEA
jgi:hypothetical protein